MVGSRSCTQVRTHAQKYFLALQKPPLPDGVPSHGCANKIKKSRNSNNGDGSSSRKKSRLLGEHLFEKNEKRTKKKFKYAKGGDGASSSSWPNENSAKRGLSGMSLLAQAAMVDPEFERLDQTVDEYEMKHGRPRDDGNSSEEDESGDDGAEDISVSVEDEAQQAKAPTPAKKKQESSTTSQEEVRILREELTMAHRTIQQMRQEVKTAETKAMEAIEGRNIAINECRELQEMNNQLKAEHRRILMCSMNNKNPFAGPSNGTGHIGTATQRGNAGATPQAALSASGLEQQMLGYSDGFFPSMAAAAHSQQMQHQDQIVIEVLQSRLKEAELRYHQVTESLARQTGVMTDQHRAVLELNSKLENERAARQALEVELARLKRQGMK